MDHTDVVNQFRQAMEAHGLATSEEIIADGNLHRFDVEGDRRQSKNGWYILHVDDRPAGQFGSWKTGVSETWTAKVERRLTAVERRELEKKISEQRRQREQEEIKIHAEAAARARDIWGAAVAVVHHPYLDRKGIRSFGVRISRGELVVPLRGSDGTIHSLQFITPDGTKRFLTGGRVQGCYCTIGKPAAGSELPTIAICEGYATGASIHQATDLPVAVAFNAGNLQAVARALRARYPKASLIICADNDQWTKGNPGVTAAHTAAQAVGARVAVPEFRGDFPGFGDAAKPTDFNDLAQLEGLPRVDEIIKAALSSDGVPPEPAAEEGAELRWKFPTDFGPQDLTIDPNLEQKVKDALKNAGPALLNKLRGEMGLPAYEYEPDTAVLPPEAQVEGHGPVAEAQCEALPSGGACYPAFVEFPHMSKKGPLATIENVEALLNAHNVRVRYDVIRKDIDIVIPGQQYLVDTARNDKVTWLISRAAFSRLPVQRVPEFVSHIAGQNAYNPVADWIASKPWDGVSRLQAFFNTVQAKNEADDLGAGELKEILMRRWMLSAIAAAFRPNGVSAHGVLTLQGDQYLGKTAWFKSLVPPELRELIADGMLLDPKDKDSVYQVVTKWLVELGEIDATFRRSDIAQLKSFLTKDRDVLRRPYARAESEFARRTVFFASVNPDDFLADPTGNRRFWIIPCEKIIYNHDLPMQQVWAEFYALYQAGESWYLTAEEMVSLNAQNKEFESVNAVEELLLTRLAWNDPKTLWQKKTATDIALDLGFREPNEKILKQVAKAVREKTGEKRTKNGGKSVYLIPTLLRGQ